MQRRGDVLPSSQAALRVEQDVCEHILESCRVAFMEKNWTSAWLGLAQETPDGERDQTELEQENW